MVITGSFQGETDPSIYIWLRRLESEEQRVALYAAVYQSEHWKTKIAPRVPEYLIGLPWHHRIVPTPKSTVQ